MMNRLSIMAGAIVAGVVVGLIVVVAVVTHRIWTKGIGLECGVCQLAEELEDRTHFRQSWTVDGQTIAFDYSGPVNDPLSFGQGIRWSDNIYIADSDGAELVLWTPPDAPSGDDIVALDYSPDVKGSKVAFATLRYAGVNNDKEYEIATANLDGSDYRRLTDEDGSDLAPSWSPDGSRIAFVSNRTGYDSRDGKWSFNVYIMDADGSNVRSVVPGLSPPSTGAGPPHRPVWSPDGSYLAFRQPRSLYTVHTESFRTVNLGLTNAIPAWSPDGEWIAFVHAEPAFEEPGTIYVARPDGSEARKVFQFDPRDAYTGALNLSWSADGLSLRFSLRPSDADRSNIYFLYQVGVDGSNLHKISEVPYAARLSWSPDGSRVAVSSIGITQYPRYDHGETLLYSMAADGSDRRVLARQGLNGPEAANGE